MEGFSEEKDTRSDGWGGYVLLIIFGAGGWWWWTSFSPAPSPGNSSPHPAHVAMPRPEPGGALAPGRSPSAQPEMGPSEAVAPGPAPLAPQAPPGKRIYVGRDKTGAVVMMDRPLPAGYELIRIDER
ncbi:MAG: hypothetical protein OZSIB_2365 [Candidatus Ozemobacter sibiricus]|uniref:Uncharacterized protein n=1 Tax=Candidatus Ozemobacter sibiricus TaxID=2268124 RepID=A0A367ZS90_9BACT|nr:MAG: hypothetical protein OZSIB_2365 [Candidatus Ozemobacter sibiricus]